MAFQLTEILARLWTGNVTVALIDMCSSDLEALRTFYWSLTEWQTVVLIRPVVAVLVLITDEVPGNALAVSALKGIRVATYKRERESN